MILQPGHPYYYASYWAGQHGNPRHHLGKLARFYQ